MTLPRRSVVPWLALVVTTFLAASATAAPAPETFQGRGVYYFDGKIVCPLAGIGMRGPHASNRVALDDGNSKVVIDRGGQRIFLTNTQIYPHQQVIADFLFLGTGVTKAGQRAPIAIHLKVEKKGKTFHFHVHAHPTSHDDPAELEIEPFQVLLSDGVKETMAMTPADAIQTARAPGLAARVASIFVSVTDNLNGHIVSGHPVLLSDISVTVLAKTVMRATLTSFRDVPPAAGKGRLAEMFQAGEWELRLTATSSMIPKDVLRRELFVLGLEDLSIVQRVGRDGLKKGESLLFQMKDGKGTLSFGKDSQELPDAVDRARTFLEYCFLGAILEHQAELATVR